MGRHVPHLPLTGKGEGGGELSPTAGGGREAFLLLSNLLLYERKTWNIDGNMGDRGTGKAGDRQCWQAWGRQGAGMPSCLLLYTLPLSIFMAFGGRQSRRQGGSGDNFLLISSCHLSLYLPLPLYAHCTTATEESNGRG